MSAHHESNIAKLRQYIQESGIQGDCYAKADAMNAQTEDGPVNVYEFRKLVSLYGADIEINTQIAIIDSELRMGINADTNAILTGSEVKSKAREVALLHSIQDALDDIHTVDTNDAASNAQFNALAAKVISLLDEEKRAPFKAQLDGLKANKRTPAQVIGFSLGRVTAGHIEEAEAEA